VSVTITDDMPGPVYFYYRLTNFYQNHRRYVKSRGDEQLAKTKLTSVDACDPLIKNRNDVTLYPCGLIANSMFNDTYDFQIQLKGSGVLADLKIRETDIAWKSDLDKKFIDAGLIGTDGVDGAPQTTRNLTSGFMIGSPIVATRSRAARSFTGIRDEHFIVWMRTAGLPTFKKLWGVFEDGFKKGDIITIAVNSVFPTKAFSGEKAVVFSTTSWLGGKNDFLGIAYVTVGALCILLGCLFWVKHCVSPRPLGDMQYLNWPGAGQAAALPAK